MDEPKRERHMLPLRELGRVLVRHLGLNEGLWDITVEFKLAAGSVGPSPDEVLPSAIAGVSQVGLTRVNKAGPLTVDAGALAAEA